ncbi:hypothetical protein A9Q84_14445 [Halobacteriovorax marinus]|uniref:Uncharacterized protein n=1 Tax=Halobacteriovorax marinus TaxID=97084 RepID=A0A1Y5F4W0_9BACT|nr:hypothetical protein A9Q84_14445 [Halobacteriovorax marinus]
MTKKKSKKNKKMTNVITVDFKPKSEKPLKSLDDSSAFHILTVYHPNILKDIDIIKAHIECLKEKNKNKSSSIYWGKIVNETKKSTINITEKLVDEWKEKLQMKNGVNKLSKLVITDFTNVYICPIKNIIFNNNVTADRKEYKNMPKYYSDLRKEEGRGVEVFFEITDIFQMSRDSLLTGLKYQVGSEKERTYSPYEGNTSYPLLIEDEFFSLDDGHNFDENYIANEKKAHFYDLLESKEKNYEQTRNSIVMNLIDQEMWSKFPPLSQKYIIEAEEVYQKIFLEHSQHLDTNIKNSKLALRYYQIIESLLNYKESNVTNLYDSYCSDSERRRNTDNIPAFFKEIAGGYSPSSSKTITLIRNELSESIFKHQRDKKIYNFIDELKKFRNFDAHPTSGGNIERDYTLEKIKSFRDRFWGLSTLERVNDQNSGLGCFHILMKFYMHMRQEKSISKAA